MLTTVVAREPSFLTVVSCSVSYVMIINCEDKVDYSDTELEVQAPQVMPVIFCH